MYEEYIKSGLLSTAEKDGLVLFNYTHKCQAEKAWDEVTLNNRGHVYEKATGKIIAHTFPKFFNLHELDAHHYEKVMNAEHFTATEKIDGSLGIIYYYKKWRVNTRGSFDSPQAKHALQILNTIPLNKKYTYIVEIVYPDNQIILDYGDEDALYLLAIFDDKGNEILDYGGYEGVFKLPKRYDFKSIDEIIKWRETAKNSEGVVVRLDDGFRVKIKTAEYIEINKRVKQFNSMWKNGNWDFDGYKWPKYVQDKIDELRAKYKEIEARMKNAYLKYADKDNKWLYTHLDKTVADDVNYYRRGKYDRYIKKQVRKMYL